MKQYEYVLSSGYVLRGGSKDYVIEEVLGRGGFGVTYKVKTVVLVDNIYVDVHFAVKEYFPNKCWRESDNITMAIPKTMHDEVVDGLKDFINEGKKLQQVCKLNASIVKVNEVFQANGTAYYVLEYLEGGDLRKLVRDNGNPLSEQQMLSYMVPIGYALECLHEHRMLHLDVKPDNIVMRRNPHNGNEEPVLIDFGIATHFNQDGTPTTKTPSKGYSPGYSPIEQYSQITSFDPRLDVYAFCATCLFLLTGRNPIEATEIKPNFVASSLPSGISSNVSTALTLGMSMNKDNRTATISDVLAGLTGQKVNIPPIVNPEPYIPGEEDTGGTHRPDFPPGAKPPRQSRPKKNGVLYAIIGLLAIVVIGLGIFVFTKSDGRKKSHSSHDDYSYSEERSTSVKEHSQDYDVSSRAAEEKTDTYNNNSSNGLSTFMVSSIKGTGACLRESPSTSSPAITVYSDGTYFEGTYSDVDPWIAVVEDGIVIGYIHDENVILN